MNRRAARSGDARERESGEHLPWFQQGNREAF
jgi:hypothetical protein